MSGTPASVMGTLPPGVLTTRRDLWTRPVVGRIVPTVVGGLSTVGDMGDARDGAVSVLSGSWGDPSRPSQGRTNSPLALLSLRPSLIVAGWSLACPWPVRVCSTLCTDTAPRRAGGKGR